MTRRESYPSSPLTLAAESSSPCIGANKATSASACWNESFPSHLNENREAIKLCINETKALLVFSQSSPTLYLIRRTLSIPHTRPFCTSVWGINLTLYSSQRAIYNLRDVKVKAFQNEKERRKRKHHHSWWSINLLLCKRVFTLAFSTCVLFFVFFWDRDLFFIFLFHCLLTPLMGLEQKMSDKRTGEWSEHWAGLVWISMVCLTQPPFHTDRSVPHVPNQTQIQFHCIAGGNNFLFQVVKKGGVLAVLNYPFNKRGFKPYSLALIWIPQIESN